MTNTEVLTPPFTPTTHTPVSRKRPKRTGYRKIRFKSWAPAPEQSAADSAQATAKRPKNRNEDSKSTTDHNSISCTDLLLGNVENLYLCPSPLSKLPVNGTRCDPFLQLPIESTGCVPSTMDYFIQVVTPDANIHDLDTTQELDHHLTLLLPFMLKSVPLFQSIIALCRASILLSLGRPPLSDKPLLYHRSRALTAVNESISSGETNSDSVLLAIAMLLTLEYLAGNAAGVAAHVAGLDQLTATRTDMDESGEWRSFVKRGLAAYRVFGSFVTGKPPEIAKDSGYFVEEAFTELALDQPLIYPTTPLSSDLCTVLARLPPGFSELCLSGRLSIQSVHILAAVVLTTTTTSPLATSTTDTKLETELQTLLSALQRLSLLPTTSLEKYLTCGLVAWCFQLRHLRPLNLFHDPPLRTFIKLMPSQEKPDSLREQNVMIWCTMAVAGALELRTLKMPDARLVIERMFALYPVTRTWEKLVPVLKTFFWTEKIGEHWRKAWDIGRREWDIVARREVQPVSSNGVMGYATEVPEIKALNNVEDDLELTNDTIKGLGMQVPPIESPQLLSIDENINDKMMKHIIQHTRGAPREMMEAMKATQCPFLQQAERNRDRKRIPVVPLAKIGSLGRGESLAV